MAMPANPVSFSFDEKPLIVIWEITRACALACRHCRADAQTRRHPLELTFDEGAALMDQVKALESPIFVLTGGDPLLRPDFLELVRYGTDIGLRVAASPSGTRLVTRESMKAAAEAGLKRVQFSLDGATPDVHDAFRRVKGSFSWTMDGIHYAREAGLEVQIGTTVSPHNLHQLEDLAEMMPDLGCALWSLFFLVPTGRGQTEQMITPVQSEKLLRWLYTLSMTAPYGVKATEAPFFRRVVRQLGGEGAPGAGAPAGAPLAPHTAPAPGLPWPRRAASFGVNDGKGFVFIDHLGEVYPSGFLPISAGNLRQSGLAEIYRRSPLFRELRNPDLLRGKCGRCEFRQVCGGSRARAYAVTGDYLESDPQCAYEPKPVHA